MPTMARGGSLVTEPVNQTLSVAVVAVVVDDD
jgi:hypothetical protein